MAGDYRLMKLTNLPALLLASMVLAPPAHSQDAVPETDETARRYTVEVIVFRYVEDVYTGSEVFVPDPAIDEFVPGDPADAATLAIDSSELVPPGPAHDAGGVNPAAGDPDEIVEEPIPTAGAVLLLRDEFSMQNFARKLELLDVYEPILHVGWTQPAAAQEESVPLDLANFGAPPPGLEGQFTLYLGRFLHLVVDLALDADPATEEMPEPGAVPAALDEPQLSFGDARPQYYGDEAGTRQQQRVRYRIHEDRIMKAGDVRYFDHPKFGVIAKVTRVESSPAEGSFAPPPGVTR